MQIQTIKQVMVLDLENMEVHGGILIDTGDIICGCCGGIIEKDEVIKLSDLRNEYDPEISNSATNAQDELLNDGYTHIILKEFNDWMNLSEEICGSVMYNVDFDNLDVDYYG